jgi:hypothetical protein
VYSVLDQDHEFCPIKLRSSAMELNGTIQCIHQDSNTKLYSKLLIHDNPSESESNTKLKCFTVIYRGKSGRAIPVLVIF